MATNVSYEEVEVGAAIPTFTRVTHFEEWNRYASVNDEFVPIHMDDVAGGAAGNAGGAFGMGNLRLSYLVNMLTEWAGDEAEILELEIRYRGINQQHDELRCIGTVIGKERIDDRFVVRLEIDVVNQAGESTAPGTASVAVPSREQSHA